MSFSEDVYFTREIDGSFSLVVVLSGETAIPVTVTITPMEISEALSQSLNSLRATSKHCINRCKMKLLFTRFGYPCR